MKVFTSLLLVALFVGSTTAAPSPGLAEIINGVGNSVTSSVNNFASGIGGGGERINAIVNKIQEAIKKLQEKIKEAQDRLANVTSIINKKVTEALIARIQNKIESLKKTVEKLQNGLKPGQLPDPVAQPYGKPTE